MADLIPEIRDALDELKAAYLRSAAVVSGAKDAQSGFDGATELAELLRELAEQAADLRANAVARIANQEKLSLAVLATRIGISKARAAQLIQSARQASQELE